MENHPPTPLFIVKFVVNRGFDKYQAWLELLPTLEFLLSARSSVQAKITLLIECLFHVHRLPLPPRLP